jgi:hypothetical protein
LFHLPARVADSAAWLPDTLHDFCGEKLSDPLPRGIEFAEAFVGEVIVSGIWTVHFAIAREDAEWLRQLWREHGDFSLRWGSYEMISSATTGYVKNVPDQAAAEALLAELPVRSRR